MATATDDNAEIRNLDARLFEKSTCWHTRLNLLKEYDINKFKERDERCLIKRKNSCPI